MLFLLNKARQLYSPSLSTLSVCQWEMIRKMLKEKVIEHFTTYQRVWKLFVYLHSKLFPRREEYGFDISILPFLDNNLSPVTRLLLLKTNISTRILIFYFLISKTIMIIEWELEFLNSKQLRERVIRLGMFWTGIMIM